MLEVAVAPAVVGVDKEGVEAQIRWSFDTFFDHLHRVALAAPDGDSVRVVERQTLPTDSAALLSICGALQLPDYYHPCLAKQPLDSHLEQFRLKIW